MVAGNVAARGRLARLTRCSGVAACTPSTWAAGLVRGSFDWPGGPSGAVVGVDPSPVALGYALDGTDSPWCWQRPGAPLRLRPFDVVTCFDVQHLPPGTLAAAACELRRVLRPEGLALLRSNTAPDGTDGSGLTPLRRAMGASGFEVRRATYANCVPALAMELRAGLRGGARPHAPRGHPGGGGLQIQLPHPWSTA